MTGSTTSALEGGPYFNPQSRHLLIEGSYDILPSPPVEIGWQRQLLMDRHVVDSTWNLFRKVHEPQKYSGNPITDALRGAPLAGRAVGCVTSPSA